MTQLERSLQTEIVYRLNRYPVVAVPSANGIYLPARNEAERVLVARVVNRMKTDGMMLPGAPDLVVASAKGCLMIELKRPASRDLFMRRPKGRLSPEQKEFRERCERVGVRYVVAYDWADVECSLEGLW